LWYPKDSPFNLEAYSDSDYAGASLDKKSTTSGCQFLGKRHKGDILLVQIYVDDIIFGSTKQELSTESEKLMHEKFQMSSMGELSFFLGLQVKQKSDGIFISQDKYVAEILKKFDFVTVKTASTLMESNKPLIKDEEAEDVDVHLYRSMIGSLMYLTASRPNITFAVCACTRFQVTLKTSHLHAVKRIFRYLKGQPKLGLWYPKDSPFNLEAYSDSDYAGATQTWFGTTSKMSNEPPLSRVNTLGSGEDILKLHELMVFCTACLNRHQVTPKECHLHAVKRIFRYLKGHPKLRLWYPKESSFDLVAYSDSDYGGATQDRKSTAGGCQFLGRRLISWQCKKQTIVTTLTTEAEYVAAASCCGQVLWIQNQLLDYGLSMPYEALSREISSSILRLSDSEQRTHELIHVYLASASVYVWIGYALTFKPTVYVSHIRQFWSTARIETTEEGAKILATIDGTPTEPHHTPSPEAQQTSPTTHSSPTLSPVTTAFILTELEITMLKARVKLLEDREGGVAERSGDDALIKGTSGVAEVPTGSGSIPTAGPPATRFPLAMMWFPLLTQQRKPLTKKQQREFYTLVLRNQARWKAKDFMGMTLEEIKENFDPVWKQIHDFIPIGSKEEAEREDLNQLWILVKETLNIRPPTSDKEMELWVELKRLYEPDDEDQLWTRT
nr:uncharacterized mitochondrial protein AtMg00810-like [Tanacetum cinerariifolium]